MASLIFVGMQLYWDRQVALGQQYQSRTDSRLENIRAEFLNDAYMQQLSDVRKITGQNANLWFTYVDLESESLDEDMQATFGVDSTFIERRRHIARLERTVLDNNYYQFRQGLLSEEFWSSSLASLKNALQDPIRREIFNSQSNSPEFQALIVDLLAELDVEN